MTADSCFYVVLQPILMPSLSVIDIIFTTPCRKSTCRKKTLYYYWEMHMGLMYKRCKAFSIRFKSRDLQVFVGFIHYIHVSVGFKSKVDLHTRPTWTFIMPLLRGTSCPMLVLVHEEPGQNQRSVLCLSVERSAQTSQFNWTLMGHMCEWSSVWFTCNQLNALPLPFPAKNALKSPSFKPFICFDLLQNVLGCWSCAKGNISMNITFSSWQLILHSGPGWKCLTFSQG